jgi:hypothetical protein
MKCQHPADRALRVKEVPSVAAALCASALSLGGNLSLSKQFSSSAVRLEPLKEAIKPIPCTQKRFQLYVIL